MQLGTRWAFGAEPPARLPAVVIDAVRTVEANAVNAGLPTASSAARWTLTWLEGNPVLELDPLTDDGAVTVIRYRSRDEVVTVNTVDGDDLDGGDEPDMAH